MPEIMYGCTSGFHFLTSNRIESVCILSLVRTNGFIRHFALLVLRVGKISQLLLLSETGTHNQGECRTEEVLPHLEMAHWWIWWSCYLIAPLGSILINDFCVEFAHHPCECMGVPVSSHMSRMSWVGHVNWLLYITNLSIDGRQEYQVAADGHMSEKSGIDSFLLRANIDSMGQMALMTEYKINGIKSQRIS